MTIQRHLLNFSESCSLVGLRWTLVWVLPSSIPAREAFALFGRSRRPVSLEIGERRDFLSTHEHFCFEPETSGLTGRAPSRGDSSPGTARGGVGRGRPGFPSPARRCWPLRSTSARTLPSWPSPSACLTPESPSSMSTSRESTSSSTLSRISSGEFWGSGRGERVLATPSFINSFDNCFSREDFRDFRSCFWLLWCELFQACVLDAAEADRFMRPWIPRERDFGATLKCGVWDRAASRFPSCRPGSRSFLFLFFYFALRESLLLDGARWLPDWPIHWAFLRPSSVFSPLGWRPPLPDILAFLGPLDTRVTLFSYLSLP